MINRITITEKAFGQEVEDLFKFFGWRFSHFRPARTEKGWRTAITGDKGFPDYVAVRDGRLVFIELKSEKGTITVEQNRWLNILEEVRACGNHGVEVYLWRPSDFDKIAELLR